MSDSAPLCSIVINNYNYDKYLPDAINSALAQSYSNTEVIVVDDGSTDSSSDVLNSYGTNIITIYTKNGGQASAINTGYKACSGDYIIFLDSDDMLSHDICEKVVYSFNQNHKAAKIQFRLSVVDASNRPTGGILPPMRINLPQGDIKNLLIKQRSYTHPPTSGNAFRKTYIDKLMPIPEAVYRKGAAAYLVYNSVLFGELISINDIGGNYRMHGNNITASNPYLDGKKLQSHLNEEITERKKQIDILSKNYNINAPEIGIADLTHIKSRLILKKLFPQYYSYGESLLYLSTLGAIASFMYRDLRAIDRPIWAIWFFAMLLSPRYIAKILVTQVTDHGNRSNIFNLIFGNRDRRKKQ